jgi:hypothetical protein
LAQAGAKGLRIVLPSTWDVHWILCNFSLLLPPRRLVPNPFFSMK